MAIAYKTVVGFDFQNIAGIQMSNRKKRGAPSDSNATNGWIVRVQRGKRYYDYTINDFQPARYTNPNGDFFDENIMNNTHIPIQNPYEP